MHLAEVSGSRQSGYLLRKPSSSKVVLRHGLGLRQADRGLLARNLGTIKKRGAADVQLGFWLAPLEDINWVDMKDGMFHDYPMPGSTFSLGCSEKTVLVHRMNAERWQNFDEAMCELHCPRTGAGYS